MTTPANGPGASPVVIALLPEQIEGPRFVLQRWRAEDGSALSRAVERDIEHLRPWMSWIADEPLHPTERLRLIETWERDWMDGGDVVLGVRSGDRVLGGCGLHRRCGPNGLEIGYWVDQDHLHQGVGTEIARLLTTAALALPGVAFVEIHHDKANLISARIPQRLGYTLVAEEPDELEAPAEVGVSCIWRMDEADWRLQNEPGVAG